MGTPVLAGGQAPEHAEEVRRGERFEFGRNWARFLKVLDERRIELAGQSLARMLGTSDLTGRRFLDVGSGSGLSSLVAHRMGATVTSFDYDPMSVACTTELRRRFAGGDPRWRIERGSALDAAYLASLGTWDIVYSWGVLHHTGDMWRALELAGRLVEPDGILFIAIYNDQGAWSRRWARIKRLYCSGTVGRVGVSSAIIPFWVLRGLAADLVWMRNPARRYTGYGEARGMSVWHDWHDWLGGYPFEFAKPEEILDFYAERGFALRKLVTAGGSVGCNEFVFRRTAGHLEPSNPE
jgi:2-polyprenyl-6-hydroxyphenyl methylase/3-demethylubiquinone-9 3-methyltransferase